MHILALVTGGESRNARAMDELHLFVENSPAELWSALWQALNINFYVKRGRDRREKLRQLFMTDVVGGLEKTRDEFERPDFSIIDFVYEEVVQQHVCCD